jgi:UDP-N-acetylmuramoyl-tripeptide--D-alanyl-D-alanine ligase
MYVNQDSRTIKKGEWFVAVKGEKFDGHKFIPEALKKGAAGILEIGELYDLARNKLAEVNPEVIAVTGSYGKTTTKEAIFKVLSKKYPVFRTKGNLNTPLGVSMEVVNNLRSRHRVLVAEVGMDRAGEIRETCSIVRPRIAVITAIGEMHLEKLGTLEKIRRAKAEILEFLPRDGVAVLNSDDPNVVKTAKVFPGRKVWYGFSKSSQVRLDTLPKFKIKLLGKASISNALAAAAVGKVMGLPESGIVRSLAGLRPEKGRLFLIRGKKGVTVIDDTYNAGPRSTVNALDALSGLPAKRRIAILGDMLELGRLENPAHEQVISAAAQSADIVVPVGERMNQAAARTGINFTPLATLSLTGGDLVLVKGSRGMRMEKIIEDILKNVY